MPPAIRTRPSASSVAVLPARVVVIEPVGLNEPVAGSYSSAEAKNVYVDEYGFWSPPAIRTRPSASSVAVSALRAVAIEPVGLKEPVAGSYSSAEARTVDPSEPPAIRTRPSGSAVAVS